MRAGRYELSDGKSHKFWDISFKCVERGTPLYEVTYGKIGTKGRVAPRLLERAEAEDKITEKLQKGYMLDEINPWYEELGGDKLEDAIRKATKGTEGTDFMKELKAL